MLLIPMLIMKRIMEESGEMMCFLLAESRWYFECLFAIDQDIEMSKTSIINYRCSIISSIVLHLRAFYYGNDKEPNAICINHYDNCLYMLQCCYFRIYVGPFLRH